MEKRKLGKTGLEVSIVSYGCIKLPQIEADLAAECLNLGLDLGITFVDTARNYRDSEEKIGKGIGHRRDEFRLATKTTARDADGLAAELDTSLTNLQTDYLDLYQLHSVSDPDSWQRVTRDCSVLPLPCSQYLTASSGTARPRLVITILLLPSR